MNISINEHYTVVNGLVQQIRLLRRTNKETLAMWSEEIRHCNSARSANDTLSDTNKALCNMVTKLRDDHNKDLCAISAGLGGYDQGAASDEAVVLAKQALVLKEENNSVCADMRLVAAVARGESVSHEPEGGCARTAFKALINRRNRNRKRTR